jgi:putative membrane protein
LSFAPRLAIAWAINLAALWAANAIWDGVRIHGWAAYLIGSAVLGIANAVLKPLLTILTLP